MRVFITGSTASQVPSKRSGSCYTFTSLVYEALKDANHDVTWIDPSVSLTKDYLSEFDSVIVGIAPPTSTAAHRIYGALSVISYAKEIGNLTLLVDAPEPKKLWVGIRAIQKNPSNLTKEFYAKRREYKKLSDDKTVDRLLDSINFLSSHQWPNTLFPSLPWMGFPSISSQIPNTSSKNLFGINYDSYVINKTEKFKLENQENYENQYWVADYINSKWTRGIEKNISNKVVSVRESRWEDYKSVLERLSQAVGCLVSVHNHGAPWWSISLPQALSQGVPVVTDWRLSSMLGSDWSYLPHNIEDMKSYDRKIIAEVQKISYLQAVPSWEKSVELTINALKRK